MSNPLKIAVAGNQWITQFLVRRLAALGHSPCIIINVDEGWADRISGYRDLATDAEQVGAEIYRPKKYSLKSLEDEKALSAMELDVLFVFGWQRLIPGWLIDRAVLGAYGVHGGPELPPRCRGRAVFNWAIILGYDHFFMYAFRLTPHVDDGDIVGLQEFDIRPDDDIATLYHKNCVVSTRLFCDIIKKLKNQTLIGTPQPKTGATYLPKREPDHGGIDWSQSARRIVDLVRALAPPYPGAFTMADGMKVVVHRAQIFDSRIRYDGAVGEILDVFPNRDLVVRSGDQAVYIREWVSDMPISLSPGAKFVVRSGLQVSDPII